MLLFKVISKILDVALLTYCISLRFIILLLVSFNSADILNKYLPSSGLILALLKLTLNRGAVFTVVLFVNVGI